MKKKLRAILYSVTALWSMLLSPHAEAKIPPVKFKNVTRCFKAGKEGYSPVVGEAALERGIIYAIRFVGDFKSAYRSDGTRNWIMDSSKTSELWKLTKNLFPSPGGSLSVDTTLKTNFGNLVVNPETVALLLNFDNAVRKGEVTNLKKLKAELTAKIYATLNIKQNPNDPDIAGREKQPVYLAKNEQDVVKDNIGSLIGSIYNSIIAEKKNPLTPKDTTKQVITAFFDEKFSTRAHIQDLLNHLDDDIVDREEVRRFDVNDELTEADLAQLAQKQDPYTLDDLYSLSNAGVFNAVTPYKPGISLIAQGLTNQYDRKTNQMTDKFISDCFEQVIRHMSNMGTWDIDQQNFNLRHVRAYAANNPYFQNFEEFFALQKPTDANDGDIKFKSAFNRFVGDMNSIGETNPVIYNQGNNELEPGYINLIKVFQKGIGLKVDTLPNEGLELKRAWLRKSMTELLTAFNPNHTYEFATGDVQEQEDELVGKMTVKVSDKATNEALYEYTINLTYRAHGLIEAYNVLRQSAGMDETLIIDHPASIHSDTSEESMRLLFPSYLKKYKTLPFYAIFNKALDNDGARKDFLEMFEKNYPVWNQQQTPLLKSLLTSFEHVLESVLWSSDASSQMLTPVVLKLNQFEGLRDILNKQVKSLYWYKEARDINVSTFTNAKSIRFQSVKVEGLEHLTGLEKLSLFTTNQPLSLAAHPKLRELDLARTSTPKGLEALHDLQSLTLRFLAFDHLDLRHHPQLKKMYMFRVTGQVNFEELSNLKNLESIYLRVSGGLSHLNLQDLNDLRSVHIEDMNTQVISLKNLSKLNALTLSEKTTKTLLLDNLDGLENLDLTGQPQLEKVVFAGSFSKLKGVKFAEGQTCQIEGLEHIGAVKAQNKEEFQVIGRPATARIPVDETQVN